MSTRAPTKPPDPVVPGSVTEQETTSIDVAAGEPTVDSLRLLDHRTRRRAIPVRLAPRGHYLALEDGEETKFVPLDDRSSHGTFLNGRRIVASNIRDGDVIRLGPVAVQYVEVR